MPTMPTMPTKPTKPTKPCYLHVQDFVDAYIGPFPNERAACEHYLWTKEVRGDSATIMGISTEHPPEGEMLMTAEWDKACVPVTK